jgi:acetyltransferase-like isoleucine patch superfamily enzyme
VGLRERLDERRRRARLEGAMAAATRVPPAHAFASYGRGSHILEPSRVEGAEYIHVGNGAIIHELAWVIAKPAPDGTPPRLVIEDGVSLLRFAKIVCTGEVIIGARCLGGDHLYISDTGYRHDEAGVPIAQQGLDEPHPVRIGTDVHLGFAAKILPGVTVGDGAYIGAGAVVVDDVPPGGVVVGNPGRVIAIGGAASAAQP